VSADSFGYEVVLGAVTPTHGEPAVVETLLDFRCEALILLGPELDDSELPTLAARAPVVVVGRRTSCPAVDVVRTADARGIGSIVDHLVAWGIGASRTSSAAADPSRRTARLDTYVP